MRFNMLPMNHRCRHRKRWPLQFLRTNDFRLAIPRHGASGLFFVPFFILALYVQGLPSGRRPHVGHANDARYYANVHSIVDESPATLKRKVRFLHKLVPAASQAPLLPILKKAGQNVDTFFRDFPNTSCHEEISETKRSARSPVALGVQEGFNYIILLQPSGSRFELHEYRTDRKGNRVLPAAGKGGGFVTVGFAAMPLQLLPSTRAGSRFLYLGREKLRGVITQVIAFAQIPGKSNAPINYSDRKETALLYLQGVVWMDPSTYQILRMRVGLLAPRPDLGLDQETTDIELGRVRFKELPQGLWLPRHVIVTIDSNGTFFENDHDYSKYRLFRVKSRINP